MIEFLQVESNASLVRDVESKAIINTNNSEFETYLKNREIMLSRVNQLQEQNDKINKLENDINDIKSMLTILINKEN
jgi:hypothetical protein